jgi:predicted nucleic acid-binding protein
VPLSYVDATVIALVRRLRIRRVFAFDDNFVWAELDEVPGA